MDQCGLHYAGAVRSSLVVPSVKSESLAQGVVMTLTLVASFLDDDSRLLWCVRGYVW
jgi:hypothetical protein